MIIGHINSSGRYDALHPRLPAAFAFLRRSDLSAQASGRHVIDGERCYAVISDDVATGTKVPLLENHRRYMDVFYFLAGETTMAWCTADLCARPEGVYIPERDVEFFHDEPRLHFEVKDGLFAVFYPGDAHRAVVVSPKARKIVIKVEL